MTIAWPTNSRVINGSLQANGGSVSGFDLALGNQELYLLSGTSISYNVDSNTGWEPKHITVNNVVTSFDNPTSASGNLTISENTTIGAVFGSERVTLTHQSPGSGDEIYRISALDADTLWMGTEYSNLNYL